MKLLLGGCFIVVFKSWSSAFELLFVVLHCRGNLFVVRMLKHASELASSKASSDFVFAAAHPTHDRDVNLALETVFEFQERDRDADIRFIDNLRSFLQQVERDLDKRQKVTEKPRQNNEKEAVEEESVQRHFLPNSSKRSTAQKVYVLSSPKHREPATTDFDKNVKVNERDGSESESSSSADEDRAEIKLESISKGFTAARKRKLHNKSSQIPDTADHVATSEVNEYRRTTKISSSATTMVTEPSSVAAAEETTKEKGLLESFIEILYLETDSAPIPSFEQEDTNKFKDKKLETKTTKRVPKIENQVEAKTKRDSIAEETQGRKKRIKDERFDNGNLKSGNPMQVGPLIQARDDAPNFFEEDGRKVGAANSCFDTDALHRALVAQEEEDWAMSVF